MLNSIYKYSLKIFIFIFSLIFIKVNVGFGADLILKSYYGINNVAKIGRLLPIEINIENRDDTIFNGKINVKVYESNESYIQYLYDIQIEKESTLVKNINVSTADGTNIILIEIYDIDGVKLLESVMNIDLSYFKNRVIIGILSDDVDNLQYFDNISLLNNNFVTKTVEITERDFSYNRKLLDQIDVLLISNKNSNNISAGLNEAIYNFYDEGNIVILSLGENGDVGIPSCFLNFLTGPTITENQNIKFDPYIENESREYNFPITIYNFYDNSSLYKYNDVNLVQRLLSGNNLLINTAFSLNDINEFSYKSVFAKNFLEKTIGLNRLNQFNISNNLFSNTNYYNIENLVNVLDKNSLPDVIKNSFLIIIYFFIISVILFTYLKNMKKLKYYGRFVVMVSFVFLIYIFILNINSLRQKVYLTYASFVEIDEWKNQENVFLNFKSSNVDEFDFSTSQNIDIFPLMKDKNEPIILNQDLKKEYKITNIENVSKNTNISIKNSKDFENNIFSYINRSHLNNVYSVDIELKYFDGEIDGRITNNMDQRIENACIYMFGKVLNIGVIEPNYSKNLKNIPIINAPINNNSMTSELTSHYPESNFVKYFLDNNTNQYFENGYFMGFVENNSTLNIDFNNVYDKYGETLIIKNLNIDYTSYDNKYIDVNSLKNMVENNLGNYNILSNTTSGENEIVNTYTFDTKNKIKKIYFDNLFNFDSGKINFFVPFYGNISLYNLQTKNYDMILSNSIDEENLKNYIDDKNKIIVSFSPQTHDLFYREISLPVIRAIVEKND